MESVMAKRPSNILFILAAAVASLALAVGAAIAAQPSGGKYHWQVCSTTPGGPCPIASVDFSVKAGKTSKIKNFTYDNGFTCGIVTVGALIPVKSSGKFHFAGSGKNPGGIKIPLTIDGKFTSSKKAVGTVVIHASYQTTVPVKFTAKHAK